MSDALVRELVHAPRVAWGTVLLACMSLALFIAVAMLAALDVIPLWAAALAATLACFAAFTPVHESAHRVVAKSTFLNDVVGHACVVLLMGSLGAYRYLHGEHHKHTNERDDDPDHWSGRGPALLLPLRFATQDLAYIAFYARRFRERPLSERVDFVLSTSLYLVIIAAAFATGHIAWLLACWIAPSRIALVVLAWTFDWLPHTPHDVTARTDRYRATAVRSNPMLTVLLIAQNFHGVHHLFPAVPFYRVPALWRAQREQLLLAGLEDRSTSGPR